MKYYIIYRKNGTYSLVCCRGIECFLEIEEEVIYDELKKEEYKQMAIFLQKNK